MKKVILSATFGLFAFAVAAEDVVVAEEAQTSCESAFDGFYFGLGMGGSFSKTKFSDENGSDFKISDCKINRFMGSAVFGAGKAFKGQFYAGLEGLIDFSGSKDKKLNSNSANAAVKDFLNRSSVRSRGITPEMGARLGFVRSDWNTLFYAKISAVFPKIELKHPNGKVVGSLSKVAPAIALGFEKSFCKKFSARLEGEYVIEQSKKFNDFYGKDVKLKSGGFNVRALVSYNVKF